MPLVHFPSPPLRQSVFSLPVGALHPAVIAEGSCEHPDPGSVARPWRRECSAWVARDHHWRSAGDRYMGRSEEIYATPPFAWPREPPNPRGALPLGMMQGSDLPCRERDGPAEGRRRPTRVNARRSSRSQCSRSCLSGCGARGKGQHNHQWDC
jgi:hypothetical protein